MTTFLKTSAIVLAFIIAFLGINVLLFSFVLQGITTNLNHKDAFINGFIDRIVENHYPEVLKELENPQPPPSHEEMKIMLQPNIETLFTQLPSSKITPSQLRFIFIVGLCGVVIAFLFLVLGTLGESREGIGLYGLALGIGAAFACIILFVAPVLFKSILASSLNDPQQEAPPFFAIELQHLLGKIFFAPVQTVLIIAGTIALTGFIVFILEKSTRT